MDPQKQMRARGTLACGEKEVPCGKGEEPRDSEKEIATAPRVSIRAQAAHYEVPKGWTFLPLRLNIEARERGR